MASTTFSAECTPARARLLQRLLAMSEELDRLALESPDGTVLEACESRVIQQGRELQIGLLQDAVARRIETAGKKGPRSASVRADDSKKIAAPESVDS